MATFSGNNPHKFNTLEYWEHGVSFWKERVADWESHERHNQKILKVLYHKKETGQSNRDDLKYLADMREQLKNARSGKENAKKGMKRAEESLLKFHQTGKGY